MKSIKNIFVAFVLLVSGLFWSCNEWLDVGSDDEILEDEAFTEAKGYRSALLGVYKLVASSNLWGQELTWGFKSAISWNYRSGNAIPKYRGPLQYDVYTDANTRNVLSSIWETAYNAIANCNNLLKQIENSDAQFEYPWEKDMIMAEARGLRALLHFEMLQLFVPAPITGYSGTAIPYVTDYPDYYPVHKSIGDVLAAVIEDLKYAQQTLEPIDVDEMRNKSSFVSGSMRLDNMDYVLFQGVGNIRSDGGKRDNGFGDGFFAFRGYRFNYWGATGLLARVYSYMRDFEEAEKYADIIIDDWVVQYQFNLYSSNPKAASNPNRIDGKRRPEPLIAFWNDKVCDTYSTAVGPSYNRMVDLSTLFAGDETSDYRYTDLYNPSNYRYRVWDGQSSEYSVDKTVQSYSNPLLPVLELPEVFFIKAECLAEKGQIGDANAVLKRVRDARGCTEALSASDYNSFMTKLVNEAERDFLTRGTTWAFLKKLNWPKMYDGTPAYKTLPEGWYVLPMPDSETDYF